MAFNDLFDHPYFIVGWLALIFSFVWAAIFIGPYVSPVRHLLFELVILFLPLLLVSKNWLRFLFFLVLNVALMSLEIKVGNYIDTQALFVIFLFALNIVVFILLLVVEWWLTRVVHKNVYQKLIIVITLLLVVLAIFNVAARFHFQYQYENRAELVADALSKSPEEALSACLSIRVDPSRTSCIQALAKEYKNPDTCKTITSSISPYYAFKPIFQCVAESTEKLSMEKFCSFFDYEGEWQEQGPISCAFNYAWYYGDDTACEAIPKDLRQEDAKSFLVNQLRGIKDRTVIYSDYSFQYPTPQFHYDKCLNNVRFLESKENVNADDVPKCDGYIDKDACISGIYLNQAQVQTNKTICQDLLNEGLSQKDVEECEQNLCVFMSWPTPELYEEWCGRV